MSVIDREPESPCQWPIVVKSAEPGQSFEK